MIAIGIRYLNGWSMAAAADGSDKATAEWPPHPDRLFMALAAAYFETDRDPREREALLWFERQAAPELHASLDISQRSIVTHYVPVNDVSTPRSVDRADAKQIEAGLLLLPERRLRQARQFPVVVLPDDTVHFVWPDAEPDVEARAGLASLCAKLTCLGHSASLVQGWVTSEAPAPNLQPRSGGTRRLRVPEAGRLDDLERTYNESERVAWIAMEAAIASAKPGAKRTLREEQKVRFGNSAPQGRRPSLATSMAYAEVVASEPAVVRSIFNDRLLMFRQVPRLSPWNEDGKTIERVGSPEQRLWLDNLPLLMTTWRNTVLSRCPVQPPPEWVSGHRADGAPTTQPHLAVLPVAHIGYPHAQGHLMGVALAIPREVSDEETGRCLWPLFEFDAKGDPKPLRLYHGNDFDIDVVFDLGTSEREAFKSRRWCEDEDGAKRWASVTPVALDRHGKRGRFGADAEEQVARACEHIGLPRPTRVAISSASFLVGGPHARTVAPLRRKDGSTRQQVHVYLEFPRPVRGPVSIGAGRFRGYGFCAPYPEGKP